MRTFIVLFLETIIRIYIGAGIPRQFNGSLPHDEMMLMNYARNLVTGNWLGTYSNFTLNKRPGFAFFLAMAYEMHIPPHFVKHYFVEK